MLSLFVLYINVLFVGNAYAVLDGGIFDMVKHLNKKIEDISQNKNETGNTNAPYNHSSSTAKQIIDSSQKLRTSNESTKKWVQELDRSSANHIRKVIVEEHNKNSKSDDSHHSSSNNTDFYIFASTSLKTSELKKLVQGAKKHKGVVVIRGIIGDSLTKTVEHLRDVLKEDAEGVIIDPMLFRTYKIKNVPSYILTQKESNQEIYDMLQGSISPRYALELFALKGDLRDQARERLALWQ